MHLSYVYLMLSFINTYSQPAFIYSKLTIETLEQGQLSRSGVFIINFQHFSHIVLVFLLLTLNIHVIAGWIDKDSPIYFNTFQYPLAPSVEYWRIIENMGEMERNRGHRYTQKAVKNLKWTVLRK